MTSHSTIRNDHSGLGGYRQDSDEEDEYSDEEEVEYSAENSRLDQILLQYRSKSQYPDTGELRRLLDDVTDDEKMELLKRHKPLWEAAQRDHLEIISTILSSLSPHQRLEVLSVGEIPPLHLAALGGNSDSVEMILSQLTSDQQLTLLSMRDVCGFTPADNASCGEEETEKLLRDYEQRANQLIDDHSGLGGYRQLIDEEVEYSAEYNRLRLILEQYKKSDCLDTGELRRLLDDVTDDEKMELLKRHEPLWEAAMRHHLQIISTIMSSLSPHQRLEVLSVGDIPPLHWAALLGNTDSVKAILSYLTSDQQLTLLSMRDGWGCTPADYALCGETVRLLRDNEQRAKQQTEVVARHDNLLVRHGDLTARHGDLAARHENLPVTREDLAAGHESALDRITGRHYERIMIKEDSTGFSYQKVMSRCLMDRSERVVVDDPYIRKDHQILNFLRLCELLVKSDCGVRYIKLNTGRDKDDVQQQREQRDKLHQIAESLASHEVTLDVEYSDSDSLHDREIRLSSGWSINIGRGLDYFKPPPSKLSLRTLDFDLRKCRKTKVDIIYFSEEAIASQMR